MWELRRQRRGMRGLTIAWQPALPTGYAPATMAETSQKTTKPPVERGLRE
jgi:hypothetical protein